MCCKCIRPRCRTATALCPCFKPRLVRSLPFVEHVFADTAYAAERVAHATSIVVEIVRKLPNQLGFTVLVQVDTRSDRRRERAVVASGGVAFLAGLKLT